MRGKTPEPFRFDPLAVSSDEFHAAVLRELAFLVDDYGFRLVEEGDGVDQAKDVPDEGLTGQVGLSPSWVETRIEKSRFPTVIRLRSRRPDLVSPFAVDFLRVPAQIGQRRTR